MTPEALEQLAKKTVERICCLGSVTINPGTHDAGSLTAIILVALQTAAALPAICVHHTEAERNNARCPVCADKEIEKWKELLKTLVERLDVIHADPTYIGVWYAAQVHLGRYSGPTYVTELEAAKAALAKYEGMK